MSRGQSFALIRPPKPKCPSGYSHLKSTRRTFCPPFGKIQVTVRHIQSLLGGLASLFKDKSYYFPLNNSTAYTSPHSTALRIDFGSPDPAVRRPRYQAPLQGHCPQVPANPLPISARWASPLGCLNRGG